tara:strand:+ start:62 stop:331 length:270 start_codon:yes stop_codon:yes gene_type:complete
MSNLSDSEVAVKEMREIRNQILNITDKYALPDYQHKTEEVKQSWLDYRQALRDLTSTQTPNYNSVGVLTNIEWPTPPDSSILNDIPFIN